jgi:hypothetical protein
MIIGIAFIIRFSCFKTGSICGILISLVGISLTFKILVNTESLIVLSAFIASHLFFFLFQPIFNIIYIELSNNFRI